jgi:methylated-DNA-[protein]-cysteine S-methyltransferase
VRVGLHTGEAAPSGDDYVAIPVHQAARVVSAAHGGQVLLTDAVAERAARQLERWLEDPAFVFDLTLRPDGTPFQQRAWQAMRDIPLGTVATYGELAAKLGSAARAVGGACGANPIPVIIPCHRVVASGHRMGGFMGHVDGDPIAIKRWLLAHEGVELA